MSFLRNRSGDPRKETNKGNLYDIRNDPSGNEKASESSENSQEPHKLSTIASESNEDLSGSGEELYNTMSAASDCERENYGSFDDDPERSIISGDPSEFENCDEQDLSENFPLDTSEMEDYPRGNWDKYGGQYQNDEAEYGEGYGDQAEFGDVIYDSNEEESEDFEKFLEEEQWEKITDDKDSASMEDLSAMNDENTGEFDRQTNQNNDQNKNNVEPTSKSNSYNTQENSQTKNIAPEIKVSLVEEDIKSNKTNLPSSYAEAFRKRISDTGNVFKGTKPTQDSTDNVDIKQESVKLLSANNHMGQENYPQTKSKVHFTDSPVTNLTSYMKDDYAKNNASIRGGKPINRPTNIPRNKNYSLKHPNLKDIRGIGLDLMAEFLKASQVDEKYQNVEDMEVIFNVESTMGNIKEDGKYRPAFSCQVVGLQPRGTKSKSLIEYRGTVLRDDTMTHPYNSAYRRAAVTVELHPQFDVVDAPWILDQCRRYKQMLEMQNVMQLTDAQKNVTRSYRYYPPIMKGNKYDVLTRRMEYGRAEPYSSRQRVLHRSNYTDPVFKDLLTGFYGTAFYGSGYCSTYGGYPLYGYNYIGRPYSSVYGVYDNNVTHTNGYDSSHTYTTGGGNYGMTVRETTTTTTTHDRDRPKKQVEYKIPTNITTTTTTHTRPPQEMRTITEVTEVTTVTTEEEEKKKKKPERTVVPIPKQIKQEERRISRQDQEWMTTTTVTEETTVHHNEESKDQTDTSVRKTRQSNTNPHQMMTICTYDSKQGVNNDPMFQASTVRSVIVNQPKEPVEHDLLSHSTSATLNINPVPQPVVNTTTTTTTTTTYTEEEEEEPKQEKVRHRRLPAVPDIKITGETVTTTEQKPRHSTRRVEYEETEEVYQPNIYKASSYPDLQEQKQVHTSHERMTTMRDLSPAHIDDLAQSTDSITYVFVNRARSLNSVTQEDTNQINQLLRPVSEPDWENDQPFSRVTITKSDSCIQTTGSLENLNEHQPIHKTKLYIYDEHQKSNPNIVYKVITRDGEERPSQSLSASRQHIEIIDQREYGSRDSILSSAPDEDAIIAIVKAYISNNMGSVAKHAEVVNGSDTIYYGGNRVIVVDKQGSKRYTSKNNPRSNELHITIPSSLSSSSLRDKQISEIIENYLRNRNLEKQDTESTEKDHHYQIHTQSPGDESASVFVIHDNGKESLAASQHRNHGNLIYIKDKDGVDRGYSVGYAQERYGAINIYIHEIPRDQKPDSAPLSPNPIRNQNVTIHLKHDRDESPPSRSPKSPLRDQQRTFNFNIVTKNEELAESKAPVYDDELERLRQERRKILGLLGKDCKASKLQVQAAEANLNYWNGQTDTMLENIEPDDFRPIPTRTYNGDPDEIELELNVAKKRFIHQGRERNELEDKLTKLENSKHRSALARRQLLRMKLGGNFRSANNLETFGKETLNFPPLNTGYYGSNNYLNLSGSLSRIPSREVLSPTKYPTSPTKKPWMNLNTSLFKSATAALKEANRLPTGQYSGMRQTGAVRRTPYRAMSGNNPYIPPRSSRGRYSMMDSMPTSLDYGYDSQSSSSNQSPYFNFDDITSSFERMSMPYGYSNSSLHSPTFRYSHDKLHIPKLDLSFDETGGGSVHLVSGGGRRLVNDNRFGSDLNFDLEGHMREAHNMVVTPRFSSPRKYNSVERVITECPVCHNASLTDLTSIQETKEEEPKSATDNFTRTTTKKTTTVYHEPPRYDEFSTSSIDSAFFSDPSAISGVTGGRKISGGQPDRDSTVQTTRRVYKTITK